MMIFGLRWQNVALAVESETMSVLAADVSMCVMRLSQAIMVKVNPSVFVVGTHAMEFLTGGWLEDTTPVL
jgi:hypothetical protein